MYLFALVLLALVSQSAKYGLVQFTQDDVYYVCSTKCWRNSTENTLLVKWLDGYFYPAKFLASSNNLKLLQNIRENLESNLPVVLLNKLPENSDDSQTIIPYEKDCTANTIDDKTEDDSNIEIVGDSRFFDLNTIQFQVNETETSGTLNTVTQNETEISGIFTLEGEFSKVYQICTYCNLLVLNLDDHICQYYEQDLVESAVGIERTQDGSLVEESSDDENVSMENSPELEERNLVASPTGYVNRRSWNDEERQALLNLFNSHIESNTLPSLKECSEAIFQNPVLQSRSPSQIKVQVQNIRNKIKKDTRFKIGQATIGSQQQSQINKRKSVKKITWTTPEKAALCSTIQYHSRLGTLPTLKQCQELISKNPVLQRRTAILIKAKINNEVKKVLTKKCS